MKLMHEECVPGSGLSYEVRAATLAVLRCIVPAMFKAQQPWALMGSTASVLQGLDNYVPPDIDLATTKEGAYIMQGALCEVAVTVRPVSYSTSGPYTSEFGIFEVMGIKVEVMGDLIIAPPDGHIALTEHWSKWSDKVRVLHFEDQHVPVVPLEWQLVANALLARPERVGGVAEHLLLHGFDHTYVEALLEDAGLGERTLRASREALHLA
jgi:hypothetical protein